jgi:poly-D-alanine transfer protein DltD
MLKVGHKRKIVTIEPVLDLDVEIMERWVREIRPETCYVGYDSKKNYLQEPEFGEAQILMEKLKKITIVRAKTVRKAWLENSVI